LILGIIIIIKKSFKGKDELGIYGKREGGRLRRDRGKFLEAFLWAFEVRFPSVEYPDLWPFVPLCHKLFLYSPSPTLAINLQSLKFVEI
jgi:hypothetical protein